MDVFSPELPEWCLVMWFSSGLAHLGATITVGLDDLKDLLQP